MVQVFLQSKRSWTAVSQICSGSRTPFGLNLEALGSILGRSWSLFGRSWPLLARSWPLLGGSWVAPRHPWEALGRLLGASWANLGSKWSPSGLQVAPQVASKWAPSAPTGLKVHCKSSPSGFQVTSIWNLLVPTSPLLGRFWKCLGPLWAPSGLQMASKCAPSGLQVASKCSPSALQVPPSALQGFRTLHPCVLQRVWVCITDVLCETVRCSLILRC